MRGARLRGDRPWDAVARLSVGARDAGLLAVWRAWFGEEIPCLDSCPKCQETLEFSLPVGALLDPGAATPLQPVEEEGYTVRLRLLTSEDLQGVVGLRPEAAARRLLAMAVVEARRDGEGVEADALPSAVVDAITTRLAEADPQAEILLNLSCAACGAAWQALFDIGEHLWRRVERSARAALVEIHTLAAAYGWSEDQILALSPWRRRRYLDLVGA